MRFIGAATFGVLTRGRDNLRSRSRRLRWGSPVEVREACPRGVLARGQHRGRSSPVSHSHRFGVLISSGQAKLRAHGIESAIDDQIEGTTLPVEGEPV